MKLDNGTKIPLCLDIEKRGISFSRRTPRTYEIYYSTLISNNRNRTFLMNKENTRTCFSPYCCLFSAMRTDHVDNSYNKYEISLRFLTRVYSNRARECS